MVYLKITLTDDDKSNSTVFDAAVFAGKTYTAREMKIAKQLGEKYVEFLQGLDPRIKTIDLRSKG